MWIDYRSTTARDDGEPTVNWFQRHPYLSITILGAAADLACWCVLDALYVIYNLRNVEWLIALFPLLPFVIGVRVIPPGAKDRWARIVIGVFLAVGLTIPLILFVGVNFHLLNGGTL
jgi:predicted membrane channel-forming protein YqfA (hemolysin III family)